jgi:DNA-binding NtrC family response regulator
MNRLLRVLIVERSGDVAAALEEALHASDPRLSFETSASLADARSRVAQGGVDVVLLDLQMPDALDPDAIASIQELAPTLPLVILTKQGAGNEEAALKAGAEDWIAGGDLADGLAARALVRSMRYAVIRREVRARFDEARRSMASTGRVLGELERIEERREQSESTRKG